MERFPTLIIIEIRIRIMIKLALGGLLKWLAAGKPDVNCPGIVSSNGVDNIVRVPSGLVTIERKVVDCELSLPDNVNIHVDEYAPFRSRGHMKHDTHDAQIR